MALVALGSVVLLLIFLACEFIDDILLLIGETMCVHNWLVTETHKVDFAWRKKVLEARVAPLFPVFCVIGAVFLVGHFSWIFHTGKEESVVAKVICASLSSAVLTTLCLIPFFFVGCYLEGETNVEKSPLAPPECIENKICRKCRKPVFAIEKHLKQLELAAAKEAEKERKVQEKAQLDEQLKADFQNYKRLRRACG